MKEIILPVAPVSADQIPNILEANSIYTNKYAETYMTHPHFFANSPSKNVVLVIASLQELGFSAGATLDAVIQKAASLGLKPCHPAMGLYLRLAWKTQANSKNTALSGQHRAPDGAVTVLSLPLEKDDAFPKGLYLRSVDGKLWLRGYVCDNLHLWSAEDLFAFER